MKRRTPEEITHELMHELCDDHTIKLPKYSW